MEFALKRRNMTEIKSLSIPVHVYVWCLASAWTVVVLCLLGWGVACNHQQAIDMALAECRTNFRKDQALRLWSASHGGIYVPVSARTPANPHLENVPERDIVSPSGLRLTLMNPAYMIRQMNDDYAEFYGVVGHVTSLKPLRPENAPDDWERAALEAFETGTREVSEVTEMRGERYTRLMRPMTVQQECMKCHEHQGYQVGDVRGGVSVSVPLADYLSQRNRNTGFLCIQLFGLWFLGCAGIGLGAKNLSQRVRERGKAEDALRTERDQQEVRVIARTRDLQESNKQLRDEIAAREQAEKEREKLIVELQFALSEVKALSGLLPICASCKKVRDDQGYWNRIETYIAEHSDAEFSHGICPDCMEELYPGLFESDGEPPSPGADSV